MKGLDIKSILWVPAALASLVLFISCRQTPNVSEELERARLRVESSDDWCFGRSDLERLTTELQGNLAAEARVEKLDELAVVQLRLGHAEEALESASAALSLVEENPTLQGKKPRLLARRAAIWMRLGELRNCTLNPGGDSCIFPIQGGGVHLDLTAAQHARQDLLGALEAEKDPAWISRNRWLLNIVAMQLGSFPESVPEKYRLGSQASSPKPGEAFVNVAPGLGMTRPDLCGGAVVEDMDGDGLLDILSSSSGFEDPVRLWKNLGNGRFEEHTEEAGLADQVAGFNVKVADYDADGDQDIFLLRGAYLEENGEIRNSLLRNEGGGRFVDVTHEAGLAYPAYPTGTGTWGDFNGDGLLDLFVGNESRPDLGKPDYPCQLFFNNGDGTFTDRAKEAGVDARIYVKGVAAGDFDNDNDLDLVVTNFGHWNLSEEVRGRDLLYRNRGDGTFEEVSRELGFEGTGGRGFGCWFFDYDNDGWLDIFTARYEAGSLSREVSQYLEGEPTRGYTRLYRNLEGRGFEDVSRRVGLDRTFSTMGCSFGDLDNDGFLDLYLGTGALFYDYLVPNITLKNQGGSSFEDATLRYGLAHLQKGHGIVFADLDNDGDQDIYAQMGGNFQGDPFPNALFQNPGNSNRHLSLRLTGGQPVGARVRVTVRTPEGLRSYHRAVGCISSFGYTPLRQEIGLGEAQSVEELWVKWPDGVEQTFREVPLDSTLEIVKGEDTLRSVPSAPFQFQMAPDAPDWCRPGNSSPVGSRA